MCEDHDLSPDYISTTIYFYLSLPLISYPSNLPISISNLLMLLNASSIEFSLYNVSEVKAYLYYASLQSLNHPSLKLVFRTSKDRFVLSEGPEAYCHLIRLCPVYKHPRLGADDL